ncbi:MAG: transketolase [Myxococcota bacterium]
MNPSPSHAPAPSPQSAALAATTVRVLTVDAVRQAGIGHVGLPLGCAEIGVLLFSEILKHDPARPDWFDRDRFVLSAGHGSMLLYSLLHLSGYALSIDEIRRFRQLHSRTPGHPEHGDTPGVETTTGPLGQGLGNAVGLALAERILASRFGADLVDHRTYALASDGDLMEGVSHEACSLAGHLGLGKLVVLYDDNSITIEGPTSLAFSEDVSRRFEAYGWEVQRADGHSAEALRAAIARAHKDEDRPHLIICRTHIGFGSPAADTAEAHGSFKDADYTEQTRTTLGWTRPPFEIPDEAREVFRPNAARGARARSAWEERRERVLADPGLAALWRAMVERELPADLPRLLPRMRGEKPMATRVASGKVINAIAKAVPSLIGGSADLAGSNNTLISGEASIARGKFVGRNLHFGVREHGMGTIANGLALHGGIRPYVGTFLVFSDYMRPAVRLAALMSQPVVFVFTHDSIFVGEDGPTHQPVEQTAALRAIPNLDVWRPADARETVVAWEAALRRKDGPTALLLSRQNLPVLEQDGVEEQATKGGYVVLRESGDGGPELVIAATGSELSIALAAALALADEGKRVRVVSLPCLERFAAQDADYRASVLPEASPRLLVEAGVSLGLGSLVRAADRFIGMAGFGASAPYQALAKEFGFSAENVGRVAREMLS